MPDDVFASVPEASLAPPLLPPELVLVLPLVPLLVEVEDEEDDDDDDAPGSDPSGASPPPELEPAGVVPVGGTISSNDPRFAHAAATAIAATQASVRANSRIHEE